MDSTSSTSSASVKTPEMQKIQPKFSPPSTPALQEQQGQHFGNGNNDKYSPYHHQLPTPITPNEIPFSPKRVPNFAPAVDLQEDLQFANLVISKSNDGIDMTLENHIGTGSNCKVYRCCLTDENDPSFEHHLVCKIPITKQKNDTIKREALILSRLLSPVQNKDLFVNFYGVYHLELDSKFCLLLEEQPCDLEYYLSSVALNEKNLSEEKSVQDFSIAVGGEAKWWYLFSTLMQSLKLMRELNIVHCDLKSSNVLVGSEEFKICDFSSSRYLDNASVDTDTTLQFLAPELLQVQNKSKHNFHTDLYSAGLILLHAATGRQPYEDYLSGNLFQLINLIKKNSVLKLLDWKSIQILESHPDIYEMIKSILVRRCDIDELDSVYNSL